MSNKPYSRVPTRYVDGEWGYTTFQTKEEFREFVKRIFKEPGKYKFDKYSELFNEQARTFKKKRMYCEAPEGSRDYIEYWDSEKEKCRKGCIIHGEKDTWYLPRYYYHWLNFLQIGGKEEGAGFQSPYIWDTQYHIVLYETLAELHGMNSVILKKRQIASSYIHACKLYNRYLFEDGYTAKLLASKKSYIDHVNGTWKMLNEYHNFNNKETAWACNNDPDKPLSWQQKLETKTADGRKVKIGTQATIIGLTMDQDPVAGVGGRVHDVFYEEGGVAPTADVTYIYMQPALKQGSVATGMFTIAGSVGELDQCKPLREFMESPESNGFYGVETDLIDEHGTKGITGLFVPEQWSYPPYIDEYGNSDVEGALAYLNDLYNVYKNGDAKRGIKPLTPEGYQTKVSQGPRNIKEAFAIRTVSIFPSKLIHRQIKRIENNEYSLSYVDLERNKDNEIVEKRTERKPNVHPIKMAAEEKRGCIVIVERPEKNAPWGTYIGSIDPVETGSTKTSDSLACVYIYKRPVEVTKDTGEEVEVFTERGKIVAWWYGRCDDPNETNETISKLVEYYRAKVTCEKNKPGFITYMQLRKRQHYLAHIDEMVFDKEYQMRNNLFQAYGWYNTPGLWNKILQYGIDSVSEEYFILKDAKGKEEVVYGVERIPDINLLKQMLEYNSDDNFDCIIAYCALMAFASTQERIMGARRIKRQNDELNNKQKLKRNLESGKDIFSNIGNNVYGGSYNNRDIYKNIK